MIIKRFCAENFRNIEKCDIRFSDGVNLLFGNNAQGKTNAVEGIYIFARGRSFRAGEDKELVRFGADGFRIYIEYEDKDGEGSLEYAFFGRERRRKKNGYKINKIREMIGSFRAVLFYPDDLELVKDGPEMRRAFVNVAISQCYDAYIGIYANYKKALENRNALLKNASKGFRFDENELLSWSEYMAGYAAEIYIMRRDYIKKLELYAHKIMKEISDGNEELSLYYKSDIDEEEMMSRDNKDHITLDDIKREYKMIFSRDTERERIVGSSLFGPHRDDMEIRINGISARSYASQGQQRSIVLSLKLGEGEVNRDICGDYPVFLFDDVLSELDRKRRKYLMDGIGERQIIITSCESDEDILDTDHKIEVKKGIYT